MTTSLTTLLVTSTKAVLYQAALDVATALGLPVTSWQPGDPTRSTYHVLAEEFETWEGMIVAYIKSGFRDEAEGDQLSLLGEQVFNVDRVEATFAETTVTLTNSGGGEYTYEVGDITFENSTTGKTYRNSTAGTLTSGPATTLDLTVVADESGSESNASVGEIDDFIGRPAEVTCTNAAAAVGLDEESDDALRTRCREKVAALSPNGPADVYSFVAKSSDLTGIDTITRTRVFPDSDTGDVLLYVAGPSGAVSGGDVTAVEDAIAEWATPLCITPTVASAVNSTLNITYNLRIYRSVNMTAGEIEDAIEDALTDMLAAKDIGGDILDGDPTGKLYQSLIVSTILDAFPQGFHVTVSSPAGDTTLANNAVAVLGVVTPTITFTDDP